MEKCSDKILLIKFTKNPRGGASPRPLHVRELINGTYRDPESGRLTEVKCVAMRG